LPKTLNLEEIAAFRDRLCDIAERLFAERGPEAVTVRELATELGVSPMTPYRYFADKDAMLAAVRARAFDRFAAVMEAAFEADPSSDEPANPYLDFALGNPAAYRMMFDVNQPTFVQHTDLLRAMQRARATMSLGVRAAAVEGLLPKGEVELVSHMIWSSIHGPIMLHLAGLLDEDVDVKKLVNAAIVTLSRGLIAKAEPTKAPH
jgi:AcrR family transcriptional regulator